MPIVADPAAYDLANVLHVDLAAIKWRATGHYLDGADSRARLSAIVRIGGADHHLEAIEVTEVDGVQCGADGVEDVFGELMEFASADDEALETVSIDGRAYVVSLHPFSVGTER